MSINHVIEIHKEVIQQEKNKNIQDYPDKNKPKPPPGDMGIFYFDGFDILVGNKYFSFSNPYTIILNKKFRATI